MDPGRANQGCDFGQPPIDLALLGHWPRHCRRAEDKGYGKRVVEMLSADLRREFPEMAGLSALNLWPMRAFYLAYGVPDQKLSQLVTESDSASQRKLKQPVSETSVQPAQG